jgi:SP family sugar:H+ symporter-like MFS transporter
LISLFTPFITSKIGFKLGFVFAGCLLASVFFVQICVPETKGLRIEEVDEIFRENKRIIHDDETD